MSKAKIFSSYSKSLMFHSSQFSTTAKLDLELCYIKSNTTQCFLFILPDMTVIELILWSDIPDESNHERYHFTARGVVKILQIAINISKKYSNSLLYLCDIK